MVERYNGESFKVYESFNTGKWTAKCLCGCASIAVGEDFYEAIEQAYVSHAMDNYHDE